MRRDIAQWLAKWQGKYPKLCDWVETAIEETLAYFRLPAAHHKHLRSTNLLERFNEEIKRRTHVVRIFPNAESCLRLVRALAVETHENWLEATRYLNMDHLKEHKKEALRALTADGGRACRRCAITGAPRRHARHHQATFAELAAHNSTIRSGLPSATPGKRSASGVICASHKNYARRSKPSPPLTVGVGGSAPPADRWHADCCRTRP